ncbi:unnamed protein product [Schistosoma curassoni]|uniref:EF-hand domain-containing protein n=1 Tax=Schistosoma curassoni TaxID=6186 RepID=A0A183JGQ3_9TREM|nr:unnamed protein product [Schistosoma curassoni]
MFFNRRNAALALPILAFTSASEPPCSSIMLPMYVKNSTSCRVLPSRVIELLFSVLNLRTLVSALCILRPTDAETAGGLGHLRSPNRLIDSELSIIFRVLFLPDMSYLNDSQEPNEISTDANYPSDLLSTNEIFKKFDENVSEELNFNDLISSAVYPDHLVSSSELSIQCGKYVLIRFTLTVTWEFEDPTLFRWGS